MTAKEAALLLRYPCAKPTRKPNSMLIPVSQFDVSDEGMRRFNEVFSVAKRIERRIIRTPSGGISYHTKGEASDWRRLSHCVEVTILSGYGFWRFQFRSKTADKGRIAGRSAFGKLRKMLEEDGVDLESMRIDNGSEVKANIQKPLIGLAIPSIEGITFRHVNHIDFHSSYPAGLANTHPEFRKTMERAYAKRKEDEIYKAILVYSIGFMQSVACCNARWAHLSKDAIADNNKRVRDIAKRLRDSGRTPLLFNTDGVWYYGEAYHGEGEGSGMGQWHNDHLDCQFRVASAGSYEFIEDGIYHPVVRGVPEQIKRDWKWGAIFSDAARPIRYGFDEDFGIYEMKEQE